jgi:prevent-host-death family protein
MAMLAIKNWSTSMITLTSTDAQNHFGSVIDTAQREPVTVTRRGQPLVFIISAEEYTKYSAGRDRKRSSVTDYQHYMQRVEGKINPATDQLTDEDINQLVHELR